MLSHLNATALVAAVVLTFGTFTPANDVGHHSQREASSCAKPTSQESGSSQKHDIISQGLERTYILRLPENYHRRDDWPLIIAYHGRGSTGTEIEGYSELSKLPAVIAYPNGAIGTGSGYRQAWQGAPYEAPGVNDLAFTDDLLDKIESELCVDSARVYATGKSNGGGFAALLGCARPERFAAVAAVAPALYPGTRDGCDSAPPVPMLEIHGVADATIPYQGDADRDLPPIHEWVDQWAERNGCETPRTRPLGRDIEATDWSNCTDDANVKHLAVVDGGHVWPGADVYSGGGHVSHTIESSTVIWDFFTQHQLMTSVQEG